MSTTNKVLVTPEEGTKVGPIHDYSDEQKAKISALGEVSEISLSLFYPRPISLFFQYAHTLLLQENDPYYKWELRWVNKPDTMPRYMRSAKWNYPDAQKRIKATIEWRRDFKPDLIPPDEVRIESETGKM